MIRKKLQSVDEQTIKPRDVFLGMICVMFFLDTVGPVASMGASAITWSIIISIVFFFPSGLIMAEMGSSFPAEGGMYAWVKKAFGSRWGARMSWFYWVNNAVWIPSTCTFTVSVFCQIFLGEIPFLYQMIMTIALIWFVILFSLRPLKSATRITNLAAFFKVFITVAMGIMALVFLVKGNQPANEISLSAMKPQFDESFLFLSALVYNYLGFEVMSSMGNRIKNPKKDIPKATIANTFMISGLYLCAIVAILIIVPLGDMSIVDAIMDCFLFADLSAVASNIVVYGIGVMFLFILFAQATTWIVGAGRLAASAARDGEMPKAFSKMHKTNDVPQGALIITGIVGTVIAVVYGFLAESTEDLFWTLFSFTNVIFLLPYIINFQGFIKLRKVYGRVEGAYHVFGPPIVSVILARLEQLILIVTIFIILFTPGKELDLYGFWGLLIGISIVLVIGEILIRISKKQNNP